MGSTNENVWVKNTTGENPDKGHNNTFYWVRSRGGEILGGYPWEFDWYLFDLDTDIVAYQKVEPPEYVEPPAPEPDYSKWIGKPCWFWDDAIGPPKASRLASLHEFRVFKFKSGFGETFRHCRPITEEDLVAKEDR